jgi:protein TonB
MFNALENTWNQSARRRWTTLASFTLQALGLSLVFLIPLLLVQGPPLLRWLDLPVLMPPPAPAPTTRERHPIRSTNLNDGHITEPRLVPPTIEQVADAPVGAALNLDSIGVEGGIGNSTRSVIGSMGPTAAVAPPPPPIPTRPLRVSRWAEGNVIYRVQPDYPPMAREAGIHGTVELRAIISKAGTIENLVVVAGHPMLVRSAINAVRQWRYRPYLLNNEPIEVETEITVNFVLSGR